MATRIRNSKWEEDTELENDLKEQVSRDLRQLEIVDFMRVKYPMYSWCLRTLSCRLHHFGIRYTDYSVDIDEVREAVEKEMKGPGRLLGYRSLHKKVREVHGLKVPRNLVYDVMANVNPEGLEEKTSHSRFVSKCALHAALLFGKVTSSSKGTRVKAPILEYF